MYNIVTNSAILSEIKKCKYFKVNLGLVSTVDRGGQRVLNENDRFSYFYNSQYKTTIYMQGSVGDVYFYVDHYIKDSLLAVYFNSEEFIIQFDASLVKEKGVEFYLGHVFKKIETDYEERIKEAEDKKLKSKRDPNPEGLKLSPGSVTYEDIKAFMENKNKNRFA